jgi:hypothetical protein
MATIDWRKAGEDARRMNYNPAQADAYAKSLNNGQSLSQRDQQNFSQAYIGSGSGSGSGSTGGSGGANTFQKVTGGVLGAISGVVETQEQQGYLPNMSQEYIKMSGLISGMLDAQGNLLGGMDLLKKVWKETSGQVGLYYQQQTELLGQINKEAGLTGEFSKAIREELTNTNPELLRMGIGFQELSDAAVSLVQDTGRFLALNSQSWKEAGKTSAAYVGTLSDLVRMYPAFEKIGVGASDATAQIEKAGKGSIALGLQAQKVTKELGANIGKINEYGFQNGIQGLTKMVQKSIEFRMSMETAFKIADDVMDPDKAIDMAANLQAIGGAIGDFNDPLKLMYMATNNVEGLQDALIGVAGSLATYNEEQGRFEITGVNLRKAKAMAAELGISYSELANGAIAAAERSSAASELLSSGLSLSDDQKEFLTNISTMKGGRMTIELQSDKMKEYFGKNEVALEELTDAQVGKLMEFQDEFKKLSTEDIVRKQATDTENISRDMNFIAALLRIEFGKTGTQLVKTLGFDPAKIANSSKEGATTAASSIRAGGEEIRGMMDEAAVKAGLKDKQGNTTTTNPQPQEHTHNHNFQMGDVTSDNIKRSLYTDPVFHDSFKQQWEKGGYLQN